jgi:hypothetical protein
LLGCHPFSAFWDQTNITKILGGYKYSCFDEGADVFTASVISAFQDLITAVLPSFLFCNLRIPFRQKVALFGIFAIGYGVVAIGALRAYYSWQIYYETYDVTWVTWDMFLVSMLELHVGCFCANAPTFKVFFNHFFNEKLASSLKRTYGSHQKSDGQSSGNSNFRSHKSSLSMTDKIAIFLSESDKKGYISDVNTGVSVDRHGGVLVQKAFNVDSEPGRRSGPSPQPFMRQSTDTADLFIGRYYDDIEMGNFTTRHNSQASSFYSSNHQSFRIHEEDEVTETVSQIPGSPRSVLPSSPRTMESSKSYRFHPHPLSPTRAAFPRVPSPAVTLETRDDEKIWRNSCPFPRRNLY